MSKNMEDILDNYSITNEEYNKIFLYLKKMDCDYKNNKDMSNYDYEGFISQLIENCNYYYAAEEIAVELYKLGEFRELIKNVIYKNNIKVNSKLNN